MISIIIPVYNVEKYLADCLDSVLEQTFTDWEAILVNDGSSDKSGEICRAYCEKDQRFRLFEQENRGVSAARNTGMEHCRGDYLFFMDADDTILPNTLDRVYSVAQEQNVPLICFQHQKITQQSEIKSVVPQGAGRTCSGEEAMELFLKEQVVGISICGKLIKRSMAQQIVFEEGRASNEDKYFLFEVLQRVDRVVILEEPYYCYWTRVNSATTSPFNGKWFDGYYFAKKIYSEICQTKPMFEAQARYQLLSVCYFLIRCIDKAKAREKFMQQYKELCRQIRRIKIFDIWGFIAPKRRKGIILLKYMPILYQWLKR